MELAEEDAAKEGAGADETLEVVSEEAAETMKVETWIEEAIEEADSEDRADLDETFAGKEDEDFEEIEVITMK